MDRERVVWVVWVDTGRQCQGEPHACAVGALCTGMIGAWRGSAMRLEGRNSQGLTGQCHATEWQWQSGRVPIVQAQG